MKKAKSRPMQKPAPLSEEEKKKLFANLAPRPFKRTRVHKPKPLKVLPGFPKLGTHCPALPAYGHSTSSTSSRSPVHLGVSLPRNARNDKTAPNLATPFQKL